MITKLSQQGRSAAASCLCLLVACSSVLPLGCTYRDPSVDILEGELRWMEDQLYFLEDQLARTCAELDECRGNGPCLPNCQCDSCLDGVAKPDSPALRTLQKPQNDGYTIVDEGTETIQPDSGYEIVPSEPQPTPALRDATDAPFDGQPNDTRFPIESEPEGASIEPLPGNRPDQTPRNDSSGEFEIEPVIEMPEIETGTPPSGNLPAPLPDADRPGERPLIDPPAASGSPSPAESDLSIRLQAFNHVDASEEIKQDEPNSADTGVVDAHITHIVAEGRSAFGSDFDRQETNADILVVVEPRNADGQYVALAGPVSIVVLDGKEQGERARVARWDFDASAVRRRLRVSESGRGAHFELTWPGSPPASDELYLFARYVTVEGRKLEADVPIQLDQVDQSTKNDNGWKVIKSKNRLASWDVQSADPVTTKLTPVQSTVQLEPTPGAEETTSDGQPADVSTDQPEMPQLLEEVPEWRPDR